MGAKGRDVVQEEPTKAGRWMPWVVGVMMAGGVLWLAYGGVVRDLWRSWLANDDFSSGLLVPLVLGVVIYARRGELASVPVRPCYWGVGVILLAFLMRTAGHYFFFGSAERFSLVVAIWGMVLTVGGVQLTRRLVWVLLFIALMVPWPNRLHQAVLVPLQGWSTSAAVFVLEAIGYDVIRNGNVLTVGPATVAVAEACSGLRMLTSFMIVGAFVAFMSRRSRAEKAILFLSGIPIAIVCNTIRLAATAIAFKQGYGERMNQWFHDFGGYAMMPLALGMLFGELWLMRRLVITAPVRSESRADPGDNTADVGERGAQDRPGTPNRRRAAGRRETVTRGR